jgi:hypothetical protein
LWKIEQNGMTGNKLSTFPKSISVIDVIYPDELAEPTDL